MFTAPEAEMAGIMSFASLNDAVAVVCSSRVHNSVCLLLRLFYGDPVVKTQQIFRKHFNIARHGKVHCRNTM
jgi:hypothetical protein